MFRFAPRLPARRPGLGSGLLSLLALLAGGVGAQAAAPVWACRDILLGDSLALGMAAHAESLGFEVIARRGAGLAWLKQQEPRCAGRLVLMFGTNDLRGLGSARAAEAYAREIVQVLARWPATQVVWATPGCFPQEPALEAGSLQLDRTLSRLRQAASWEWRELPALHRGRLDRCVYETRDGVHPRPAVYGSWWSGITAWLGHRSLAARR